MKKKSFVTLLILLGLGACTPDEDFSRPEYPVTPYYKIELSETLTDASPWVNRTQTFIYEKGRIINYITHQSFQSGDSFEMQTETQICYNERQATVRDDAENVFTYTLNDKGYAISCIQQEGGGGKRTYTFSYSTDTKGKHYLQSITETMDGNDKPYSTIRIDYSDDYQTLQITQQVDNFQQTYLANAPTRNMNANISEIPNLFLTELYPLSRHSAAIYGKLLGDTYDNLVTKIIPGDSSDSKETVTYSYKISKEGLVTLCQETIHSNEKEYKRNIRYTIE